jgi:hypothetical protein
MERKNKKVGNSIKEINMIIRNNIEERDREEDKDKDKEVIPIAITGMKEEEDDHHLANIPPLMNNGDVDSQEDNVPNSVQNHDLVLDLTRIPMMVVVDVIEEVYLYQYLAYYERD